MTKKQKEIIGALKNKNYEIDCDGNSNTVWSIKDGDLYCGFDSNEENWCAATLLVNDTEICSLSYNGFEMLFDDPDDEIRSFIDRSDYYIYDKLSDRVDEFSKNCEYGKFVLFLVVSGYKLGKREGDYCNDYTLTLEETATPTKTTYEQAEDWADDYYYYQDSPCDDCTSFEFIELIKEQGDDSQSKTETSTECILEDYEQELMDLVDSETTEVILHPGIKRDNGGCSIMKSACGRYLGVMDCDDETTIVELSKAEYDVICDETYDYDIGDIAFMNALFRLIYHYKELRQND